MAADVDDRKPKLHLKAQLFLSREAEEILKKLDWPTLVDAFLTQSMKQVHDRSQYVSAKQAWIANEHLWDEQLDALVATTTPEERARAIAYLSVGSHNMDYRGLMMDGEVLYVTASRGVLPGMLDLVVLLGLCDWVDDAHTARRRAAALQGVAAEGRPLHEVRTMRWSPPGDYSFDNKRLWQTTPFA